MASTGDVGTGKGAWCSKACCCHASQTGRKFQRPPCMLWSQWCPSAGFECLSTKEIAPAGF